MSSLGAVVFVSVPPIFDLVVLGVTLMAFFWVLPFVTYRAFRAYHRQSPERSPTFSGDYLSVREKSVFTVFQFLVVAETPSFLSKKVFDSFVRPYPLGQKR